MAHSQTRYIPKLNDRDVIRAFEAVLSKNEIPNLSLRFNDALGPLTDEEIALTKKLAAHSLTSVTLSTGGALVWQWTRLRAEHGDPHSANFDKLAFSWNPNAGTPDRARTQKISAALDTALSRPLATVDSSVTTPLSSHSEILLAMESATAKILSEATEHRQELDRAYLQKEEDLNARIVADRERELSRLTEERLRIDAELKSRSATLDDRQKELDSLQKKLDDRNNTHVRREIRASLLELARERLANFAVSRETRNQYFAVHIVAVVGLLAMAFGSVYYGSHIEIDPKTGAYPAIAVALGLKSAALAAATIALGSWYLGWLNRWLQRIADAEFKLQQFRLDIERASWLAETVLEWKSTSPAPFPELLATRLSTGLFSSSSSDFDDPKTPATHLAEALFGAASSAKIKLGNQEVAFDRKAIKRLDAE